MTNGQQARIYRITSVWPSIRCKADWRFEKSSWGDCVMSWLSFFVIRPPFRYKSIYGLMTFKTTWSCIRYIGWGVTFYRIKGHVFITEVIRSGFSSDGAVLGFGQQRWDVLYSWSGQSIFDLFVTNRSKTEKVSFYVALFMDTWGQTQC